MTECPTVEQKSHQTPPELRPTLSLTWSLDPTTGKPMARWTTQQPEMIESLALQRVA
jgi:hypothetical protein